MEESDIRFRERAATQSAPDTSLPAREASGTCPNCGAVLDQAYELCPECGAKLADYCTFCGAPMRPDDLDCPECGMPSEGVVCPRCQIRNYRAFCRQCNQPLSRAARRAVEKAKQDPKVQEAARLLAKISELEAELDGRLPLSETDQGPETPTEGAIWLQDMMAKVGFTPAEMPKATRRQVGRSRETVMDEYKKAVEEAGATPQEQRNYYTARKVAVMEVMETRWYAVKCETPIGWVCNRCQVFHNSPEECAVREFGGKWITTTKYKVVDEGTKGAEVFVDRVEKKVYKRQ